MNRRRWLAHIGGTALLGAAAPVRAVPPAVSEASAPAIDPASIPGYLPSELGSRAPGEKLQRLVGSRALSGYSQTPLEELQGLIAPADLHFERHHGGVPQIDASHHELAIHGLCAKPQAFDLAALKRFPAVTRQYFLECSGNGYAQTFGKGQVPTDIRACELDGLFSVSEWTGVPLKTLLAEVQPEAQNQHQPAWLLAEGADSARMTRSIPVAKALDDALVVYAQNGEALRPGQGHPFRLLLPGWEGNTSIKWLRRIEIGPEPFMTREETSKYSDAKLDGSIEMFTFTMGPKSLITSPSFPQQIPEPGRWEIRGLAWSGHGKVRRVDVSTDGGKRWRKAHIDGPVLSKNAVTFRYPWRWDGKATLIMSRTTDEKGNRQLPVLAQMENKGPATLYHNNAIRPWAVAADGKVTFGLEQML